MIGLGCLLVARLHHGTDAAARGDTVSSTPDTRLPLQRQGRQYCSAVRARNTTTCSRQSSDSQCHPSDGKPQVIGPKVASDDPDAPVASTNLFEHSEFDTNYSELHVPDIATVKASRGHCHRN